MDLLPSPDQLEVAQAAADVLDNELPVARIRERRDETSPVDGKAWTAVAELGLLGLALPEESGGAGCGLAEEALAFREIGRRIAPGPFLSSVLAARVAVASGDESLAAAIVSGETAVGLVRHVSGDAGPERLTGRVDLLDAVGLDYALVVTSEGAGLVRTDAIGTTTAVDSIDPGVRLTFVEGVDAPITHWVPASQENLYLRGLVLISAMLVGAAEATRDMSVDYAKTREQYGRPIGVNQAIKHTCADMAVGAEAAFGQLVFGSTTVDSGREDAEFQARTLKLIAGRYAKSNAAKNVQVHGGMGYTWEHDAHLYVKRVEIFAHTLGTSTDHQAALLELPAPQ
jgi:alkylation response protein AidB-like acyl-CoA dehydrogenase